MRFKNFIAAQHIKRFMYFIPTGLALLLFTYGSIAPVMAAGPEAHLKGEFGHLHSWPIIPIHMTLMPDGRVLAVGKKAGGGNNLRYAIWDPAIGIGTDAFETLPNITGTDIFCAGQALIPSSGQALIVGGDSASSTIPNYGPHVANVNIFDPATDTLSQTHSMTFKRWYATAVTLPNGEHLALGGRNVRPFGGTPTIPSIQAAYSPTPEIRAVDGSWRTLSAAVSDSAYGKNGGSWSYPRAWVNPQGNIFILTSSGLMYKLDTANDGTLLQYTKKARLSKNSLPSVMFSPGLILSLRNNRAAIIADINGSGEPVLSSAGNLAKDRSYSNATVLADGRVWVNGGSSTGNNLSGAALDSELWDPATKIWTTAANAATVRLYHSASLLLSDGTVLTGGGGVPGPIKQLNGEIYYPPYLFKADGSGEFASRPEIIDAPTSMVGWDQEFSVEANDNITRITLVRAGAATHAFNNEQRFFELPIPQIGNIVTVRSPASANAAPPGFYLLFVWNASGTPSVAKFMHLG